MSLLQKSACAIAATATALTGLVVLAPASDASSWWSNCTAVHHRYPHGVGKKYAHDHVTSGTPVRNFFHSTYWYNVAINHNHGLDRDHDGVACEAH